jgi:linoleoyl-CoA desaturase
MIRYSKNKIDFLTELRTSVNDYFKNNNIEPYGDTRIIVKSVFMGILYLAPLVLMISGVFTSVWAVLACWMLMGLGKSGVGMATMHDANHGSFSKQQRVNKAVWQFHVPAGRFSGQLALPAQHASPWLYQCGRAR